MYLVCLVGGVLSGLVLQICSVLHLCLVLVVFDVTSAGNQRS